MPTVLTTSTQHANLKHCDSLAFFTTQHLRPSDHHTKALFQHARPDAGAGCCRGGTRAAAVHPGPVSRCTSCSCTLCMDRDVRTAPGAAAAFWHATMCGQALAAVHHGPSVRTDGPTGRPGECCASGWCTCMDRALRTARHGAASGVRAYATMRARCSNARGGACTWTDDRCSFALCHPSVHAFA